jgi:hypothetical protein
MPAEEIPDTPAGRQLRWWLQGIEDPETLTAADVLGRYKKMWPGSAWLNGDAEGRQEWANSWQRFGEFTVDTITSVSDVEVSIVLAPKEGRLQKITFIVEAESPHRIVQERWDRVFDFDLVVREATPADAATLADIERRSPVTVGGTRIVTDRGPDYFAAARLIGERTVFIAEVDGDPAGVAWGAQGPARFLGEDITISYLFHLRVVPEHQRKGLWGALDGAVWSKYWETSNLMVGYYLAENVAWSHVADQRRGQPDYVARDWVPTVYRILAPTARLAGTSAGRPATPDDAGRIAAFLNETHEGEQFYPPATAESVTARLNVDPGYSWDRVLVGEGSVLGVWPAGRSVEMVTERDGESTRSRRGHVMDYGFREGYEDEFSGLLAASAAVLLDEGIDTLSIFTSKGATGNALLREFNAPYEAYRFSTGTSALIPNDAQLTGIYVDHLFF